MYVTESTLCHGNQSFLYSIPLHVSIPYHNTPIPHHYTYMLAKYRSAFAMVLMYTFAMVLMYTFAMVLVYTFAMVLSVHILINTFFSFLRFTRGWLV